jgi:hypothetical protein
MAPFPGPPCRRVAQLGRRSATARPVSSERPAPALEYAIWRFIERGCPKIGPVRPSPNRAVPLWGEIRRPHVTASIVRPLLGPARMRGPQGGGSAVGRPALLRCAFGTSRRGPCRWRGSQIDLILMGYGSASLRLTTRESPADAPAREALSEEPPAAQAVFSGCSAPRGTLLRLVPQIAEVPNRALPNLLACCPAGEEYYMPTARSPGERLLIFQIHAAQRKPSGDLSGGTQRNLNS